MRDAEKKIDMTDKRILELLQKDASMPLAELAHHVRLTQTPCWKRVQRLKRSGVIRSQVTLCDAGALGVGITAFMTLRTNEYTPEWADKFAEVVGGLPEVVEVYRMTGDNDYLLRVVVADIADYDRVHQTLVGSVPMRSVASNFAIGQVKYSTALPVRER
jgi:Lrp/AsnC family transcriptional regulator